ncbi:GNAT family N-acetyltransferase [Rhizosphaericola mali]|uniref:GNAT family N-acetyltransferase n=1 Tax=Rhizosphaericola mali TaxID=2545455 RepID=A0A5P2G3L4_9BACT|nr:GNAT family N-acetyltransferase [Rhizosphaericola mali]QES90406.1 GNAT family N-acetyltransferase [Rhizosphaericola mali]
MQIIRTDSTHPDFLQLVKSLDADLAIRDGAEHAFYAQFNKVDLIKNVVVLYENEQPVACGAIKEYAPQIFEIKRMFTDPTFRGKGLAGQILNELANWAKELSAEKLILETGLKQPEAIRLYEKNGFQRIPNFGQYVGVSNSVCFEKILL